eukprot:GHUV01042422.1.p1 GENE.GHUV01042422.1~~GHUV01042422.1.p1  ORF type:complete len:308 (+),score=68.13 GHUV01042422.1:204-1127(+)
MQHRTVRPLHAAEGSSPCLYANRLAHIFATCNLRWPLCVGITRNPRCLLYSGCPSVIITASQHLLTEHRAFAAACSALAFAPRQYGLILAAACQEQYGPGAAAAFQLGAAAVGGTVTLWEAAGIGSGSLQWMQLGAIKLPADTGSIRCMCWREAAVGLPPLLALGHDKGGCIWAYRQEDMAWQELCSFSSPPGNQQSLLAINWAPALGRPFELLAASYGTTVVLYKALPAADGAHGLDVAVMGELQHPEPVWKLEFNMLGNMLACSLDRRPEIWFWVPPLTDGPWRVVSRIVGTEQQAVDVGGEMLD